MKLVPADHPALRVRAAPIPQQEIGQHVRLYDQLERLRAYMQSTCLSASQVGIELSFFVAKVPEFALCINPSWEARSEQHVSKPEGSPNWPGCNTYVRRCEEIAARFEDRRGIPHEITLSGMEARVFQHACDYLRGEPIWRRA